MSGTGEKQVRGGQAWMRWCPVCKAPSPGKNFCPVDGSRLVDPPAEDDPGAVLIVDTPGRARRRIPLSTSELTIGKGTDTGLVVLDPTVSQHHATVRRSGATFEIVDHGSRNGTIVNGTKIVGESHTLATGDEIRLGQTRMQ